MINRLTRAIDARRVQTDGLDTTRIQELALEKSGPYGRPSSKCAGPNLMAYRSSSSCAAAPVAVNIARMSRPPPSFPSLMGSSTAVAVPNHTACRTTSQCAGRPALSCGTAAPEAATGEVSLPKMSSASPICTPSICGLATTWPRHRDAIRIARGYPRPDRWQREPSLPSAKLKPPRYDSENARIMPMDHKRPST